MPVSGGPGGAPVLHRVAEGVSWITLNRPEALNAVTAEMRESLVGLLEAASADPGVRAVVLTGAGRGFCAGADLRAAPNDAPGGAAERVAGDVARMLRRGVQRLVAAVLDCEKPVLAAVNGPTAGVGVPLALACDLVLMADTASLVPAFVRRGLVPDGGAAYLLPRLVGPQRAKELLFLGDRLTAADAERLGLVNRVVPAAELEPTARAWAARLASGPTRTIALTKELLNTALEADRSAAFAAEAAAQEANLATADAAEGVRAFVERREPDFTGR
ncbi:enoyl-CoA hydratase/isomerase family protein [Streptacidiphilus sp. P02-A3a]|uniref:enoyl-CoA hydratase/isomerase family protein n=1 Tax=Streptacidiphilus sp. P02-A3a TaxID=2704468 RepID=UPI0015FE319E|nr:enoyl-CoA hydratase [Streptacidiphilus sp. P02-A3a]QMU72907.1 enoyl-CoA hydratase [Streptacidiphilus sp. P02-A3a]